VRGKLVKERVRKSVVGGKVTEWNYNPFGEMTGIDYHVTDPSTGLDVSISRDDAGLAHQVTENFEAADGSGIASGTTTYSYSAGRVDKVEYSGSHPYLPDVRLDYRTPDASGRRLGYDVFQTSGPVLDVAYSYDTQGFGIFLCPWFLRLRIPSG
jgi:hypothetical protein